MRIGLLQSGCFQYFAKCLRVNLLCTVVPCLKFHISNRTIPYRMVIVADMNAPSPLQQSFQFRVLHTLSRCKDSNISNKNKQLFRNSEQRTQSKLSSIVSIFIVPRAMYIISHETPKLCGKQFAFYMFLLVIKAIENY